ALLADEHARDVIAEVELALDGAGKFEALRLRSVANVGAYLSSDRNMLATFTSLQATVGVYDFKVAHAHLTVVFSNSAATAPYRCAGRPEAIYIIERLIDDAARELRLDPAELRRRNLVPSSAMPYRNAMGFVYDSGEFPENMAKALELADYRGF